MGGCAPSHAKRGKLNDIFTSLFSKFHLKSMTNLCYVVSQVGRLLVNTYMYLRLAMKIAKTRLRNRLTDTNLSSLMKLAINGSNEFSDSDLDHIWSSNQELTILPCIQNFMNFCRFLGKGGGIPVGLYADKPLLV